MKRLPCAKTWAVLFGILFLVCGFYSIRHTKPIKKAALVVASASLGCPSTKFGVKGKYYSQFYEDYVLSEIFKSQDKGFYVDVGANDPISGNATYFFYKKGWKGVLIEPNPNLVSKLKEARPEDLVVAVAVSNKSGCADLYVPDVGTEIAGLDAEVKGLAKRDFQTHNVEVKTLTQILDEVGAKHIDFIKIDVEGHEAKVLEGLDFKRFRPEVFVMESFSPTNHYGYLQFESILLQNGYLPAISDGLNKYYYAKEAKHHMEKFASIDKCIRIDQWKRRVGCYNGDACKL